MELIEFIILFSCPKYFTFGSKEDQPLSTSVTSRSRSRKSTDLSTDVITVSNGLWQQKRGGVWGAYVAGEWTPEAWTADAGTWGDSTAIADAGTWGDSTAIRLKGTSSDLYNTPVEVTGTIHGVADVFTIVTMIGTVETARQEDGTPWLQEDGTQIYQEGA